MGPMFSSSISAIGAASSQFAAAAGNIANATTPGYRAQRVNLATSAGGGVAVAGVDELGEVDLASEFTGMILARAMFKTNVAVLKSSNEMLGDVLDLIA
ncbi:MAG: hypothetical protein HYY18_11210 [Planctomycetes bacterium]|nr:hypothetical protein [Planctomycetota bacterium]